MNPLGELSLRDLIWLRAARELKAKEKAETEKVMLDLKMSVERRKYLLLCDLRSIMFGTLGYEEWQAQQKWCQLPSMIEDGIKPKQGMSRGVREAEKQK